MSANHFKRNGNEGGSWPENVVTTREYFHVQAWFFFWCVCIIISTRTVLFIVVLA